MLRQLAALAALAFAYVGTGVAGAGDGIGDEPVDTGTEVTVGGAQIGVIVWNGEDVQSAPGVWPKCTWSRVKLGDVAPDGWTLTLDELNGYLYRTTADGDREYLYREQCDFADGSSTDVYAFIGDAAPVDVTELARAELFELTPSNGIEGFGVLVAVFVAPRPSPHPPDLTRWAHRTRTVPGLLNGEQRPTPRALQTRPGSRDGAQLARIEGHRSLDGG